MKQKGGLGYIALSLLDTHDACDDFEKSKWESLRHMRGEEEPKSERTPGG